MFYLSQMFWLPVWFHCCDVDCRWVSNVLTSNHNTDICSSTDAVWQHYNYFFHLVPWQTAENSIENAQHILIFRFFFRLFALPIRPTGHEQLNWQNTHTSHIPTEKQSCVIPSQSPYQPLRHTKDLHPCRWKSLCLNIHSLAWKESHNSSKLDTVISAGREKKTEPIHNFSGRENAIIPRGFDKGWEFMPQK